MSSNLTSDVGPQVVLGAPLIGSIVAYACVVDPNSPPPDGWLLCNGSAVSRSTYAGLFKVIGTLHGGGDGVNTFNLPDYRGRMQRGVDDGTGRDPDASTRHAANIGGATGDSVATIEACGTALPVGDGKAFVTNQTGAHTHSISHLPKDNSWYTIAGSHYCKWNSGSAPTSEDGKHTHTIDGGGDNDTVPINVYANYLICCGPTT